MPNIRRNIALSRDRLIEPLTQFLNSLNSGLVPFRFSSLATPGPVMVTQMKPDFARRHPGLRPGQALVAAALLCGFACAALAQAPDVPIFKQGRRETQYDDQIRSISKELFRTGEVAKLTIVKEQLKRTSCRIELPAPRTAKLSSREICALARHSHLRIGWAFVCGKCDQWHANLAGGYLVSPDGVVATCYHVVQPGKEVKDGCLIAADENATVFPITEVLAADRYADAALLRVSVRDMSCLSLNTNVCPGDSAYCYSDPLDHRGYFSSGIVNRFYQFPGRRRFSSPESASYAPTRLNVSTDWAPGSSGSAVLDECGNAIGHVSTISAVADDEGSDSNETHTAGPTMIVFHEAVSARDLLRLIKSK